MRNQKQFGRRLKKLRLAQKLTQQDLGSRAGLHGMTVSRFERGTRSPTVESLLRLADALGVGIGDLVPEGKRR